MKININQSLSQDPEIPRVCELLGIQNIPFQASFLGMVDYKLIRDSLKLCDRRTGCGS